MEPALLIIIISVGVVVIVASVVAANAKKLNQQYKDRKKNK
jgi:hypothetical protein